MLDSAVWRVRSRSLPLDVPLVMGVLNVTPDSFSDGGLHADVDAAVEAGVAMADAGAAIVDVGGESTRPGASPVDADTEIGRILPVVSALSDRGIVVSLDTSKAEVAAAGIERGASIVNDVTGFSDPDMRSVCAEAGVGVVLMHMKGTPTTMQEDPVYDDVVGEVSTYLAARSLEALEAGVGVESIAIDPGIGFGKSFDHNLELLGHLETFTHLGYPLAIGTSRKGFLGAILEPLRGRTRPDERDAATAATVAFAVLKGAHILRVHNVPLGVDVAVTAKAMVRSEDHGEEINRP